MAKITIVIEDSEDGEVQLGADFEPPIRRDEEPSAAQCTAMIVIKAIQRIAAQGTYSEEWEGEEE